MSQQYVLKAENIVKEFPGVRALDNVGFEIYPGEITGLAGANGAGKSTLIKIFSGMYQPDSGKILFEGKEVNISSPQKALTLGIHTTYQEINMVPHMSVSDNIFLGQEIIRIPFGSLSLVNRRRHFFLTNELLEELGILDIVSPNMKVGRLGSMELGIIQIAKAVARKSKLLIMDEPTSLLSRKEIDTLFETIRKLRRSKSDMGVIFITHRLEEFSEICGRTVVLRDGKCVGILLGKEIIPSVLSDLMIGHSVTQVKREKREISKKIALEVEHLSLEGVISDINFVLRRGEIVGLTGLVGAGKTELLMTLFGAYTKDSGKIKVNGREAKIHSPEDAIDMGIGLVPEERKLQGLILDMTVSQNTTIAGLDKISKWGLLNRRRQIEITKKFIKRLKIDPRNPRRPVRTLSGGNQQKVVISKWMMLEPQILLADEVTRGIDVKAKEDVRRLIKEMAQQGTTILMSATEIDEVLSLSDRILVMANGRIIAELQAEGTNKSDILKLCLGDKQ